MALAGAVVLSSPVGVNAAGQEVVPACFVNGGFAQALAEAKASNKPLVAVFTATWCGPCKMMERSVWRERTVDAWIRNNAIAVLVDIDRDTATSKAYDVRAVPTTIVFTNGQMADRTSGSRSAQSMLTWLSRFGNGSKDCVVTQEPAPADAFGDPDQLTSLSRQAAQAGRSDEAALNYAQAWRSLGANDDRRSKIEIELREIANASDAGKRAVAAARDKAQGFASAPERTITDVALWLMLCDVVEDRGGVIRWFDAIKSDRAALSSLSEVFPRLGSLLLAGGRGSDGAQLITEPAQWAQWRVGTLVGGSAALKKAGLSRYREDTGRLYGALQSAGRSADALVLANAALQKDDSAWMRIVFVRRAVDGHFSGPQHARWLSEAEKAGANVSSLRDKMSNVASVPTNP
jgi:thiol-disulfide isomerase/thioredoxin